MPAPAQSGLDAGPPLPPGMTSAPAPASPMSQMAGQGAAGQPAGAASSSLQASVIQDFMLVEKTLQSIASKLPSFAPIASQMTDQLRAQGGQAIAQSSQPSSAPASPLQALTQSLGSAPQM